MAMTLLRQWEGAVGSLTEIPKETNKVSTTVFRVTELSRKKVEQIGRRRIALLQVYFGRTVSLDGVGDWAAEIQNGITTRPLCV